MKILTTPIERFNALEGYPYSPNYIEIESGLQMHYVDDGSREGEIVLLLHGEPSWSYLYRKMIPILADAGFRVIAPDLIGFGKSDKPSEQRDYSYKKHVDWVKTLITSLNLTGINLFCQDWGGLIGLRVAAEMESRFARIVAANTFLPTGNGPFPEAFLQWQAFSQKVDVLPIAKIMQNSTVSKLSDAVLQAYEAPFPDPSFQAGAKIFPSLVPTSPEDPACEANIEAWKILSKWEKPFLTLFSDQDPITHGGDRYFIKKIPGTKGQAHQTIKDGGHFLQEDKGEEIAEIMVKFIKSTT